MLGMDNILLFSLIVMRISGCILFQPILGRRNIPGLVKGGIILVLSMILITSQQYPSVEAVNTIEYVFLLLKELFVGFTLGFIVNLFLYIIILAGELIDFQMGLSMSKIYDAQSNSSIALSSTFYNILFVLLFFVSDAHLALIQMFLNSGQMIPYGALHITEQLSVVILQIFSDCTILAVKFAMPLFAVELLFEIGVGILMKTIPQINVFIINIQVKIMVGIVIMILMFSPMSQFLDNCIIWMFDAIRQVMELM